MMAKTILETKELNQIFNRPSQIISTTAVNLRERVQSMTENEESGKGKGEGGHVCIVVTAPNTHMKGKSQTLGQTNGAVGHSACPNRQFCHTGT
jgi:hypothetical protein